MGLDNFPATYPCSATAVRDGAGRIDCDATQNAGGCPWKTNPNRPTAVSVATGLLGTYCWYRGKYGEYLLEILGTDADISFYGDDEEGTQKSPDSCRQTATAMRTALADLDDATIAARLAAQGDTSDVAEFRGQVEYATWWLDWVADTGDGSTCWY